MNCVKCGREVYDGGDTCIFHCEKNGWEKSEIKIFQEKFEELTLKKDEVKEDIFDDFIFTKKYLNKLNKNQTYYNNVVFKDVIKINNETFSEELIFKNCIFEKPLYFKDCTFEKELKFKDTTVRNSINFKNSKFEFKAYFFNVKEIKFINFKDVIFNELKINDNKSNMKCDFINTKFYDNFESNNNRFKKLNFNNSTFTNLSVIKINDCRIDSLSLDSYKCHTTHISFKNITVKEQFYMNNINLNNEVFNKLELEIANIEIKSSTLNQNLFNSTVWGDINNKRFRGCKSVFRELKHYSELSKNFIDSSAFYSLEMRAKKEELYLELTKVKTKNKKIVFFIKHILMYELYENASNYSENWLKPLLLLLSFGMYSYIVTLFGFLYTTSILTGIILFSKLHQKKFKYQDNSFYILIFIICCWYLGVEYLYTPYINLSTYISPFGLFKINGEAFGFWEYIQKLIVLILGYQIMLAIRANIRNK